MAQILQMLCHDVLCYDGAVLANGKCLMRYTEIENGCYSMGMKLTATEGAEYLTEELLNEDFWLQKDIESDFEIWTGLHRSINSSSLYFYHFKTSGVIDFIYVHTIFFFQAYEKRFKTTKILNQLNHYEFSQDLTFSVPFDIELILHNVTFSSLNDTELTAFARVHHGVGASVVTLTTGDFKTPNLFSEHCPKIRTQPLIKLYHCPYIVISKTLLPMETNDEHDYLFFRDESRVTLSKVLSNWHYFLDNTSLSICLEDYLSLYQFIPDTTFKRDQTPYSIATEGSWSPIVFVVINLARIGAP